MVISWPLAWAASTVQDFTATPSMATVQAPHCVVSQPTWVPVSLSRSRRKCTSRVRAGTSAVWGVPLTVTSTVTSREPAIQSSSLR